MRTVVTSGAERREVDRFARLNDAFIATLMGVQRVQYLTGGLPSLLIGLGTAAAFFYGGWRVVEGTLTPGTLAMFLAYQARVIAPVQALMGLYGALATARVSWRRVAELLGTLPEVTERAEAEAITAVTGELAFDAVSLSYGRGGSVLDRVSVPGARRPDDRGRRHERQRQVDHRGSRGTPARSRRGHGAPRRPRPSHAAARGRATAHPRRAAGTGHLPRLD